MSLRLRIFILFFALLSVALSFTLYTVDNNVRAAGEQRVFDALSVGHNVFQDKIETGLDDFVKAAKFLAKEDGLREAVFDDQLSLNTSLGNFLQRMRSDHKADFLWLLNYDASLMGQAGVATGDDIFAYQHQLNTMDQHDWAKGFIAPFGQRLYEVAIVGFFIPVSAPLPSFWIVVGRELDDDFTVQLAALTNLHIYVTGKEKTILWAKSDNGVIDQTALSTAKLSPSGIGFPMDIRGERYLALKIALESDETQPVSALLLKSPREIESQLSSLTSKLLVIGVIALFVSSLGAALLSKSITRPLQRIVEIAQQMGRGDYSAEVPSVARGEVGTLSRAFNSMRKDIAKREEEIQFIAYHDGLTKLPNRNAFIDKVARHIQASADSRQPFAVCFIDFDRFQDINDTLGHHNGDRVLISFANRLAEWADKKDMCVSRLGGDEFAVLITQREAVDTLTDEIHGLTKTPIEIERIALEIRLSMGISFFPEHGETPTTLLQTAEVAMYLAKQDRRNIAFYEKHRDHHSTQRLTLMAELGHAIKTGQLALYYQPKLDIKKQCYTHVECLVRWIHPKFGFINPEEFIGYAEQTGAIRELTQWVVQTALEQCLQWKNDGIDLRVAINISAIDLTEPGFADWIISQLTQRDLVADSVVLEVTESAVMRDIDIALATLQALNKSGVSLSIDDYGTGYSSMAQLKCLPVDELKIDKSFVMSLQPSSDDYVIVKSTIELGHNMGLKLVAEGVETQEALDLLSELGCDMAQGYFLSRPLSPDQLPDWVSDNADKLASFRA